MERSLIREIATNAGLQAVIDNTSSRYDAVIWPSFFRATTVGSLSYETLIGRSRIAPAGTVTNYNVSAPKRTVQGLEKLSGKIPSIRDKWEMDENTLLDYIQLSNSVGRDAKRVVEMIFDLIKNASIAGHKRLDAIVLEIFSTGKLVYNAETNPAGIVTEKALDFLVPESQKLGVTGSAWGSEDAKVIDDIQKMVELADGKNISKIRMTRSTYNKMMKSKQLLGAIGALNGKGNVIDANRTFTNVSAYFSAMLWPEISIVDEKVAIEIDGEEKVLSPWKEGNISMIPDGVCGDMLFGPIAEREFKVDNVSYADYNGALVKSWGATDPVSQFVGYELNAFPSWENANHCIMMNTQSSSFE